MEDRKTLPDFQFGFRREHSTTMALLRATKIISDAFNNFKYACMVQLDMEAAFDKVNQNILIRKLVVAGLPPYLIKLIYSYLCGRRFEVQIDDSQIFTGTMQASVPQGSNSIYLK